MEILGWIGKRYLVNPDVVLKVEAGVMSLAKEGKTRYQDAFIANQKNGKGSTHADILATAYEILELSSHLPEAKRRRIQKIAQSLRTLADRSDLLVQAGR